MGVFFGAPFDSAGWGADERAQCWRPLIAALLRALLSGFARKTCNLVCRNRSLCCGRILKFRMRPLLVNTPALAFFILFFPSSALPRAKPVWQTGEIVAYSVPAPLEGRMTNGEYTQTAPQFGSVGRLSSYTIQSRGTLFYCSEWQLIEEPPQIALHSMVRFYRVKDHLVLIDESGRQHKAHVSKQVALHP